MSNEGFPIQPSSTVQVAQHAALTTGVHGITAAGAALIDDADASAQRTTLGLGTAATQASTAFASSSHASGHAPGGSDALPWTTIHGRGATGSKPAASSVNAGYLYYDTTLSQLERSNGTSWDVLTTGGGGGGSWGSITGTLSNQTDLQNALNAKASTDHDATHAPGGSDALPWGTAHGYGPTGSKPAASSVNAGYLYYDTTLSQIERSDGATWSVLTTSGSETVGFNWTTRTSAADNTWYSVCYGNGLFVAIAVTGTGTRVMTSTDGINWTTRTSSADNDWRSVCYGNGLFVAVAVTGTGNRVMTSPDGIDWTIRTSAADNNWASVCYGNGLFVAVAYSGTGNRVMTSSNGIDWTIRTSAADNNWASVCYGNGIFVAVAYSGTGNRVMTSSNGIDWTIRTSAADNDWLSVCYGNGIFVAVAYSGTGNRAMTSQDGINWAIRTSAADNGWRSVCYGNGIFVAVASSGTGDRIMTSPDGINWTIRTSAADNDWRSVCYGNGIFVSVASSGTGTRVMTSGRPPDAASKGSNTFTGTQIIGTDPGGSEILRVGGSVQASSGFFKGANEAVYSNDSRLSDARTPTAHSSAHAPGGSDALPWGTAHGYGPTGSKPAASSVNAGYLYYDTTLTQLQRSNGTSWDVLTSGVGGTSQVQVKETRTTATTAWTVTLPAACKAVRVTVFLAGAVNATGISVAVNGVSSGHREFLYASNGTTVSANEASDTVAASLTSTSFAVIKGEFIVGTTETYFNHSMGQRDASDNLVTYSAFMRIAQSADISSITFTSNQTNGIGSGSYIIVERVDAEVSQDIVTATKVRMYYDSTTGEFGPQQKITNRTGAATVKGTIVEASTSYDMAFAVNDANGDHPIGVVYEAGVADGSDAWVWSVGAICQVLLVNSTASTRGYWAQSGSVAGRADITNANPNSSTHWGEIGHCLESKTAGTNVLAKITLHFN